MGAPFSASSSDLIAAPSKVLPGTSASDREVLVIPEMRATLLPRESLPSSRLLPDTKLKQSGNSSGGMELRNSLTSADRQQRSWGKSHPFLIVLPSHRVLNDAIRGDMLKCDIPLVLGPA